MIDCGTQITICDLPVHFDNYIGCSHACEYCFVKRIKDISKIKPIKNSYNSIKNFIDGKRNADTDWCDWNIPVHWGGAMSDPFQPIEKANKDNKDSTLNILKLLAETYYPVVISTKGKLCIEQEYLEVLKHCNVVMQVSCVSKHYDKIEKGATSYKERLEMIKILSKNVQRVLVRLQPYMPEVKQDILKNSIKEFADAGAYGCIFEAMKYSKKPINCKYDLEKVGSDLCYNSKMLYRDFKQFKDKCHEFNMKFYSGENRLRRMGDSLCCCGVDDLFRTNKYNCNHLLNNDYTEPTEIMKCKGTARVFHAIYQCAGVYEKLKELSFEQAIMEHCDKQNVKKSLGIK